VSCAGPCVQRQHRAADLDANPKVGGHRRDLVANELGGVLDPVGRHLRRGHRKRGAPDGDMERAAYAPALVTRGVAAFDVDGTLTRRDTLLPFLVRATGRADVIRAMVSGLARTRAGTDRDRLKALVVARLLRGQPIDELRALAEVFADHVVAHGLRASTAAEVVRHREAGRVLVMVSASPELYLEPLAARLGFHAVLGTRLEVGDDGRLTGRIDGPNLRGAHKVARLREWLGPEPVELWAYGDAGSDRDMLAMADHPVWVGRRSRGRAPGGHGA
jgi:phosphatidylglycerophosphatase C